MRATLAVALAAVLLASTDASAQWPPGGKLVLESNEHTRAADFMQHPSGNIFLRATATANTSFGFGAALIQPTGVFVAGWPSYFTGTGMTGGYIFTHAFAVDDSGNVWHSWASPNPSSTRLELLTPGGLRDPSPYWTLSSFISGRPTVLATGVAADAYTLNDIWVQRTRRTGVKAAGWPTQGRLVPVGSTNLTRIIRDGEGGIIALGQHPTLGSGVAVRVDSNSTFHSGWPVGGLVLNTDPDFDYAAEPGGSFLTPAGPGFFLAAWKVNLGSGALRSVRVQRFSADGALDPNWPVEGALVTPEDSLRDLTMLADGSGGAYVLWNTLAGPRGSHILANCTFPSGLDASGQSLLDDAAEYVQAQYYYWGFRPLESVVASVRPGGGLMVAWGDSRLAPTVSYRVRWLQSDLLSDPARPDDGLAVMPSGPDAADYKLRAIQAAPDDGAYVAWEDHGQFGAALWMTRASAPVVVGVPPGGAPHALALSAPRPNPSRGDIALDVTLAVVAPVRVELLDIAGRVLRTRELHGRGTMPVEFSGLSTLPPGLYFLRASGAGTSTTRRVVLER